MTDDELYAQMTPRMRDFARILITGPTDDAGIAAVMGVRLRSTAHITSRLFELTGMSNRTELALFIVRRPKLEQLLCEGGPRFVRKQAKLIHRIER
jgi:DNA-binding NarL/FixJ family response regulator